MTDPSTTMVGQSLLAAIIRTPELLREVPQLEPDDFADPQQRTAFEIVREALAGDHGPTELSRDIPHVRGWAAYLRAKRRGDVR